jgi:predicted RNA-binding protein with PUA-like domain
MKYWILKTEPESYSFQDLITDKKTAWTGVRNYQARNNIRLMSRGDLAIIYESVGPKAAVGIAKVASKPYKEIEAEGDWAAIDIVPIKNLSIPLTLSEMKNDKVLKAMILVKNSRLSVCPLLEKEFRLILKKGGVTI